MLAAGAGGDVFGLVGKAVVGVELLRDRGTKFVETGRGRVLGLPFVECGLRRVLDEGWRIEVRLTGPKSNHVDPRLLHGVGLGADGQSDRIGNKPHPAGKRKHRDSSRVIQTKETLARSVWGGEGEFKGGDGAWRLPHGGALQVPVNVSRASRACGWSGSRKNVVSPISTQTVKALRSLIFESHSSYSMRCFSR